MIINETTWMPPNIFGGGMEEAERTQPHNINERLLPLPGNHFDLVNQVCPFCESNRMIKQYLLNKLW